MYIYIMYIYIYIWTDCFLAMCLLYWVIPVSKGRPALRRKAIMVDPIPEPQEGQEASAQGKAMSLDMGYVTLSPSSTDVT